MTKIALLMILVHGIIAEEPTCSNRQDETCNTNEETASGDHTSLLQASATLHHHKIDEDKDSTNTTLGGSECKEQKYAGSGTYGGYYFCDGYQHNTLYNVSSSNAYEECKAHCRAEHCEYFTLYDSAAPYGFANRCYVMPAEWCRVNAHPLTAYDDDAGYKAKTYRCVHDGPGTMTVTVYVCWDWNGTSPGCGLKPCHCASTGLDRKWSFRPVPSHYEKVYYPSKMYQTVHQYVLTYANMGSNDWLAIKALNDVSASDAAWIDYIKIEKDGVTKYVGAKNDKKTSTDPGGWCLSSDQADRHHAVDEDWAFDGYCYNELWFQVKGGKMWPNNGAGGLA